MSNWLRSLGMRARRAALPIQNHAHARPARPRLETLEDRLAPATTPTFVNDNWNLVTDLGTIGVIDSGDIVNNANDTINPAGVTAIYGVDAFGTVTSSTIPLGPTGSDPAFDSINDAIANTTAAGTVNVLEGSYNEAVVIDKTINLRGAQAGVDARGRAAQETVITSAAIVVELRTGSADSTIDGLTISGGIRGIESTSGPLDNLQVLNNRIIGFSNAAVFLNNNGVDITLSQNLVDGTSKTGGGGLVHLDTDNFDGFRLLNNNILNGATGTGFFVDGDHNIGASAARAPVIQGNLIADNNTGMNLGSRAFEFGEISGNTFHSNSFDGLQGGIQNSTIVRNTFSENGRSGLALTSFGNQAPDRGAQNTQIRENFFQGNVAEDILLSATQAAGTIATNVISGNSLTSATAVTYAGTEFINASGNWWNSNTGPTLAGNVGGTGAAIGGTGAANVDFTPWLDSGADTNVATAGFQGNFATLHADDDSPQVGGAGRIQEAIDLATGATPTVIIEAGTYAENVLANKAGLTLDGATALATDVVIDPLGTTDAIVVSEDNVTIRDLRVSGADDALLAADVATLSLVNIQLGGNTSGGALSNIGSVNFTGSTGADTITISGTQLSATNVQAINLTTVADLNAFGDAGNDTFEVTPAAAMTIDIDGDLPAPPAIPGDRLNVNTAGTTNASVTSTSTPDGLQGSYTFGNRSTVTFREVETLGAVGHVIAVGAARGQAPRVTVFNTAGAPIASFLAFEAGFRGGVNVAVADVNADATLDIIVASGPGGPARVKIVDGTKLGTLSGNTTVPASALLGSFFVDRPSFAGGVFVAAGDVNNDGRADIVTGLGAGGESRVKVIDATRLGEKNGRGRIANSALLGSFLAYHPSFRGGVTVAAGNVSADNFADIVVGPASGAQRVKVIDGTRLGFVRGDGRILASAVTFDFFAYEPGFSGGVFVATALVNSDARADIITGPGPGREARVNALDATRLTPVNRDSEGRITSAAFIATEVVFGDNYRRGVQVGAADLDADNLAEVLVGFGRLQRRLLGLDFLQDTQELSIVLDFNADSVGGK